VGIFRIPLTEACTLEVTTRVAYQVVVREWRKRSAQPASGTAALWLADVARLYDWNGWRTVANHLSSFSLAVGYGMPIASFLSIAVSEARQGRIVDVRRAVYPDYKSQRRATPRVTNRGGQKESLWSEPRNNATIPDDLGKGGRRGD